MLGLADARHLRELELGFIFLVGDELEIGIVENAAGQRYGWFRSDFWAAYSAMNSRIKAMEIAPGSG